MNNPGYNLRTYGLYRVRGRLASCVLSLMRSPFTVHRSPFAVHRTLGHHPETNFKFFSVPPPFVSSAPFVVNSGSEFGVRSSRATGASTYLVLPSRSYAETFRAG